ncbi:MAG: tetratricopeptide repeat protein [Acidobacteria bacterium]|nr:tetratricopeptide repeat protein [Acidobacteriota bacterium]
MISKRLVCVLLPAMVVSLSCVSAEKQKLNYVNRGNEYFKNGKYREAAIMYKSALKKDLKYGEAYYRLALTDVKLGRLQEAMSDFRRALDLQPDNMEAASNLADIYMLAYMGARKAADQEPWKKLLIEVRDMMAKKATNSFAYHRLRGVVGVIERKNDVAIDAFAECLKQKPFDQRVLVPYLEALFASGRFPDAEQLALEAIKKDPSYAQAYDWLYLRYAGLKRVQNAEKIWQVKVANNPKQAFYVRQLAYHYFLTNQRDQARKVLEPVSSNTADFPLGNILVGDFYMSIGDVDNAVIHYEKGIKNEPKEKIRYQKKIVETLVHRARNHEAMELVQQILKEDPKDNEAIAFKAALWLQEGNKDKVASAIQELNSVIQKNPDNVVFRYNLGRAYVVDGKVDAAIVQFQEALKYDPRYTPARLALANIHVSKQEWSKALQAADEVLSYDTRSLPASLLRAASHLGMRDVVTARQELGQILQFAPNNPDAIYNLGVLNFSEKKWAEASASFSQLQKVAPNDPRGLIGQAEVLSNTGKHADAIKIFQDDLAKNPERIFFRLALANTAVQGGKFDLAIDEYRKLLDKNPKNFDVQIRLAETFRLKGDIKTSIAEFQKAREIRPTDPTAYQQLAMLYESQNQASQAKPLYEQILKIQPDNPIALNNLAYMLAEQGTDLDQALTLAQRARAKLPQAPDIADTLGWIYVKKRLTDQAIRIFREISEKDHKNPIFRYHLCVALEQKGDKPTAKKECDLALKNNPDKNFESKIRELLSRL